MKYQEFCTFSRNDVNIKFPGCFLDIENCKCFPPILYNCGSAILNIRFNKLVDLIITIIIIIIIIIIIKIMIMIMIMIITKTLFRCRVIYIYLAGQRLTNWGHHLYHSHMTDKYTHKHRSLRGPTVYITSFSEKTRRSKHSKQRRNLLRNYFKTLSIQGPIGNRTQASRTINCLNIVLLKISSN